VVASHYMVNWRDVCNFVSIPFIAGQWSLRAGKGGEK